jgi:acetate kinase
MRPIRGFGNGVKPEWRGRTPVFNWVEDPIARIRARLHRWVVGTEVKTPPPAVLTINAGSSSLRFAVFEHRRKPRMLLSGKIDRIGRKGATLTAALSSGETRAPARISAPDHGTAAERLMDWLEREPLFASVGAVGHRVVHGMGHPGPARVTPRLLSELRRITPYDPDHLPEEIGLIEAVAARHPRLPQLACFDTSFHRTMPPVARLLPIPWRYAALGVERYGFHGLSYQYLVEELVGLGVPAPDRERVVLAHLGNGASLAAVRHGRSIDTSMGFTPAAGLVMGSRSGDLDPGLLSFLARRERMTPGQFDRMVNHESGLLGISGKSADMRDLLAREGRDRRAATAVALFCYQARKWIGSYAAALGGLDTLVFAGGIGENAPRVRARICLGLEFLGIAIDGRRNAGNEAVISPRRSPVTVRVIHTDEELMIARSVWHSRILRQGLTPWENGGRSRIMRA